MKTMTSNERLLAAMRRKEVDRIPLSPRMGNVFSRHYDSGGYPLELKIDQSASKPEGYILSLDLLVRKDFRQANLVSLQ